MSGAAPRPQLKRLPMSTVEILVAARALIGVRERWCAFDPAQNEVGWEVAPRSSAARSWCALGAVQKVAPARCLIARLAAAELLDRQAQAKYGRRLTELNDYCGYPYVLEVYDLAIAAARKLE